MENHYFAFYDVNGEITQKLCYAGQAGSPPPGFIEVDAATYNAPYVRTRGYRENRAMNYPSIGDQLDALWKGSKEADEMKQKILDVKQRYPKE